MEKKKKRITLEDIYRSSDQMSHVNMNQDVMDLPYPFDNKSKEEQLKPLTDDARARFESSLDDTINISIPRPASLDEERRRVRKFLEGLEKLFSAEENWTFLLPLTLSIEHCTRCQTCSDSCHTFEGSGRLEVYRPTYRAEILRRIYFDYIKPGGKYTGRWKDGAEIPLKWITIARLAELAYRCNLCRRCAQTCPIGVDNGLIAREIRKLFSQELGIAPKELHENGSMLQLKVGSSTGMNPGVVKDNIEFIDDDMSEKTGLTIKTPWDVKGADVLVIHNAGEILAWPENVGAFAAIFQSAGVSWTMSSDIAAYDSVNYGLWYDDVQFARVAVRQAKAAEKLGVKMIMIGECGHAHKALTVTADRLLTGETNIPRVSAFPILRDIVMSGKLQLDPSRNNFPVTLHDPCNLVRLMGIVMPQREILKKIAPKFREMTPHGVNNYCCGGGSGFAIQSAHNFKDWRVRVSGRMKLKQILNAFSDSMTPDIKKYVCAPCSNCKGQIRDIIAYHDLWNSWGITYGGLVELIVNAMTNVKPNFINWDEIM